MIDDGRYIAPALGILDGEAAGQEVSSTSEAFPSRTSVWHETPTGTSAGEATSYYELPLLKEPVWKPVVPVYFYVGGVAGAAAVLGAAAQAVDGADLRSLVKSCRWIAAIGGGVGSVLLVYDLGRPERFLHMLRVLRPTSPMSVGSWVLAGAASCTMGSALLADSRGVLGRLGDAAGYTAAVFGLPLTGYTAVLLSNTAVPVWSEARRSLPPLFIASSMSALAALFGLLPLGIREQRIVERFGTAGELAELASMAAVERETGRVDAVSRPLREGLSGSLWTAAKVLTAAGLAVALIPGRSRAKRVLQSFLGTAGALSLRFAVFQAGKASVRDPQATFRSQRAR